MQATRPSEDRDETSFPEPGPPLEGLKPRPRATLVVFYDEGCGPCTHTARLLDRLNWRGRVRFRQAAEHPTLRGEQYEDIQSIRRDGRSFAGFSTYQQIAWRLPLLWLAAPLLHVWPVTWIGRRIYRRVADKRRCLESTSVVERSDPS